MRADQVLITGFGPFPGVADNPSSWIVQMLARTLDAPPLAAVLPVSWQGAWAVLEPLLEAAQPHHVILFGISARARGFCLEQRAYNANTASPDANGAQPREASLLAEAPESLDTTLPLDRMRAAVAAAGLPVELSGDPGRYLCNATLFRTLHWAQGRATRAGFIHIPPLGADQPLTRSQGLTGARLILEAVLRADRPAAAATRIAGAE